MKKISLLLLAVLAAAAPAFADTISGTVQNINPEKNSLTLAPKGEGRTYKVVWDEKMPGADALENCQIGDELALEANRNFFTRNWKVKTVNPANAADAAIGDTSPSAETLKNNAGESLKNAGESVRDAGETVGANAKNAVETIQNSGDPTPSAPASAAAEDHSLDESDRMGQDEAADAKNGQL